VIQAPKLEPRITRCGLTDYEWAARFVRQGRLDGGVPCVNDRHMLNGPCSQSGRARFFNKIKQCRRVATRYNKLAANYLAFIQLASIRLWPRTCREVRVVPGADI